jgi:hypothetical protein
MPEQVKRPNPWMKMMMMKRKIDPKTGVKFLDCLQNSSVSDRAGRNAACGIELGFLIT